MKCILHKLVNNKAVPTGWYENLKSKDNVSILDMKSKANHIKDPFNDSSITIDTETEHFADRNPNYLKEDMEAESSNLLVNIPNLNSKLLTKPDVFI